MRFLILSGAYVNSGDFLIVKRTKELLKHIYKDCEIKEIRRNKSLDNYIEEINTYDAMIIAGGPAYMPNLYPKIIPMVSDLSKIKIKIVPIGCGWYGALDSDDYIYNHLKFDSKTKELIDRINRDCNQISCRDWYSVKSLTSNGFSNGYMTGCPAWYNIEYLDKKPKFRSKNFNIRKICISDPANPDNIKQTMKVVLYIKRKYENAEIKFIFHRREKNKCDKNYQQFEKFLIKNNINFVNISGSADGFKEYDDCDLHVGYRVHAHIYNLSIRNLSILIEEDGRGRGVNDALSFFKITAFDEKKVDYKNKFLNNKVRIARKKFLKKGIYKTNKYIINELFDALNEIDKKNYIQYEIAFDIMRKYYGNMIKYIKNVLG